MTSTRTLDLTGVNLIGNTDLDASGAAVVHGGPFPATSAPSTTSVGSRAIERFLRPVAYQNVPEQLLPPELRTDNPLGIPRRIDGTVQQP
jgi:2,5-dioxopentanoate dehydrogenase